ncbi:MAG TPA: adenylate/guanylate cyclase domain-containing protein, partial [Alphaproteobacteria bacterium]|nr:adenylate/guanylate cyclase domain-containing protein [Alphaproteobacteria bacterium]
MDDAPFSPIDEPEAAGRRLSDWLIRKGRFRPGVLSLVSGFGRRANEYGIPLWRVHYVVQTLHPLDRLAVTRWYDDGADSGELRVPHGTQDSDRFRNSPIRVVFEGGGEIRRRLEGPGVVIDFPVLQDVIDGGGTDYLALPVPFSDGQVNAITLATRAPGGFAGWMMEELRHAVRAMAPLLEVMQTRALAKVLLDTYLGANAGERVLRGAITRGSGETIRAAVWFCDLRGFTELSERLPRQALIELLNAYFGAATAAVERHGGEVLKFIGDAVLAIFPLGEGAPPAEAAERALRAATEAAAAIAAGHAERQAAGLPKIRFGLALHIGDVLYGNIGGTGRLDFTVIGPAVNAVTRIEGLTKALGRSLLVSQAVAEALPGRFE